MSPLGLLLLVPGLGAAVPLVDGERVQLELGGDLKNFLLSTFPYDSPLLPEDPSGQGILGGRLKVEGRLEDLLRFQAHAWTTATAGTLGTSLGFGDLSGFAGAPQVVDLSWDPVSTSGFGVEGRVDRLALTLSVPHLDVTAGRQPVTFGRAFFFTPMDLVAPFSPLVVDNEYKPGVDALRVDGFWGTSGHASAVATWAGDWSADGTILALNGGATLAGWDLEGLAVLDRGDPVLGGVVSGSLGSFAVRAEGTVTFPEGEDTFVRAVLGADRFWASGTTWSMEVYLQTWGAEEPGDYLAAYTATPLQRGQAWTVGRWYAATSVGVELNPLIHVQGFAIGNLADGSVLVGPGVSWSVAAEADLVAGGYYGLGKRPETIPLGEVVLPDIRSEFGLVPAVAYVETRMYF